MISSINKIKYECEHIVQTDVTSAVFLLIVLGFMLVNFNVSDQQDVFSKAFTKPTEKVSSKTDAGGTGSYQRAR